MEKITVSIIMPCYNASAYLREAIESVLSQSYQDWELIIVDDGSTDNSREIAREYVAKDKRIHLIEQPNSGACRARNNGIEHAKGEYIKFLDADDVLEPECLTEQVSQICKLGSRQIPFGDYYNIDKNGKVLSKYIFKNQEQLSADPVYFFIKNWRILITSPLHRTELLRGIGGFNESLKRGQESDLHLRLALADVEFVYKPCNTFRYRDHNASTRISEKYQEGTKERLQSKIQYNHILEKLLYDKYGILPEKYMLRFANAWFSYSRELFSKGKYDEGCCYLNKAKNYGLYTKFQRFYCVLGSFIGFLRLEKILQLRLKLLHKK